MTAEAQPSSEARAWVRPLVRYVDEDQAVIDTHVFLRLSRYGTRDPRNRSQADMVIRIEGPEGRVYEQRKQLDPKEQAATVRFELLGPKRWWPANMGEQTLYELTVEVECGEQTIDTWKTSIGLTSVRTVHGDDEKNSNKHKNPLLLVNGRECSINSVVPVDPIDEQQVLAVGPGSLLVVRDHFGPDVLYNAADRAGILLVQSVPSPEIDPRADLRAQVDRLAGHPSLAGWLVHRLGQVTDQITESIRALDPTRNVFRRLPVGET